MNDKEFEALDDRASKAASNVKAAAARRPRPAFDADRPMTMSAPVAVGQSRAPRRTAWVAAAAVVALVAGAVTFAATRPDDGKDTVAAAAVEEPRPFVTDDLPEGFAPLAFMDLIRDRDTGVLTSSMPVYGQAVDLPLAGATVLGAEVVDEVELTPFEVDGLTLYRLGGQEPVPGHWVVLKDGGSVVLLVGATEDDAVTLARNVTVVGGELSVDDESLPDGWRRLVTVDDPMTMMFNGMRSTSATKGYYSAYAFGMFGSSSSSSSSGSSDGNEQIDDDFATIQISSTAGDEATMWAGRLFVPDAEEVTVRGHRGFSGAYPVDDAASNGPTDELVMRTVSWLERPGEVVTVTGINVSEQQLLAVAESVRPADDAEWAQLVEDSQLGGFEVGRGGDTQLGRTTGTFDDGTKWSLAVVQSEPYEDGNLPDGELADGGVYTELRVVVEPDDSGVAGGRSSGSSTSGGARAFLSVDTSDVGGRFFSSGIIADDVARLELQTADGSVLGDAQMVEVSGLWAYVTELTEDPTVLVAFRADGSEAGRVTIEALDENTTVDMDGNGQGQGQVTTFEGEGIPVDEDGNPIPDAVRPTETTEPTGDQPPG